MCQINCASESSEIYFNNTVESENLPNTCTSTITTFKVNESQPVNNNKQLANISDSEHIDKLSAEEDNIDILTRNSSIDINELQSEEGSGNINSNSSSSNSGTDKKSLHFASLNVCGLRRKVLFPDFADLIPNLPDYSTRPNIIRS